jgi:hypothetical protein
MSWGLTARLPLPTIDFAALERAAREIVERSGRHMRYRREGRDLHFIVDGPEVRPWETALGFYRSNELDEHWRTYGYDGLSDVALTISATEYPLDEYNERAYAELSWDTACSGNGLCPMIGQHLFTELANRLGAVVQP